MKVLVTGGAGYIGSHTAQSLLGFGHEVVVFDNFSTGFKEAIPQGASLIIGDVRDSNQLAYVLRKEKIEAVIHFAAKLIVPESVVKPLEYYDNNVGGVVSLLKACQICGIDKIVFSSSASIYGNATQGKASEKSPIAPLNPYAHSKAISEQILVDAEVAHQIRSVRLRYFNVAGAAIDESNGPRTTASTHLIKVMAEAACKKRSSVKVFGVDYPTPDGTCIRDYIHISDLAELHVRSLHYLQEGYPGTALNCGYGKGYSVREVANTMKKVSGFNFVTEDSPRRPGDAINLIADSSLIREKLSWTPKYDNLEIICSSAFNWETKQQP